MTSFLVSVLLSPLIGLIFTLISEKKDTEQKESPTLVKLVAEGDSLMRAQNLDLAIEKYKSALGYSSKAPKTNFKLAKIYSLKNDTNTSLFYLSKAIEQGYNNFEKINKDIELAYLRTTKDFKHFVENGYSLAQQVILQSSPTRVSELEKLGFLLEKGLITQDEFEAEKKKILTN